MGKNGVPRSALPLGVGTKVRKRELGIAKSQSCTVTSLEEISLENCASGVVHEAYSGTSATGR